MITAQWGEQLPEIQMQGCSIYYWQVTEKCLVGKFNLQPEKMEH